MATISDFWGFKADKVDKVMLYAGKLHRLKIITYEICLRFKIPQLLITLRTYRIQVMSLYYHIKIMPLIPLYFSGWNPGSDTIKPDVKEAKQYFEK